ncbi:hypothetical protein IE077_000235 [Cardiosporidium cionae]|uniref:HTH cro/C1-type domain-containing protein n=1 Tax=Cardiosporidium cionae TaxID=476202 RepID=A0ABQ7JCA6_9APIC|nr:hypothetical protein IE077_000235 [Cardiosporidium cionae]|eukprot:KAF8821606.1 hypothetical protein IE077_000235 [Cardiosporidium cionae]
MGKSQFNSVTRMWWGHVHLRLGGTCQIRPNRGFKPTQFTHLGEVLEFARMSIGLRPSTVGEYLNRSSWGVKEGLNNKSNPAAYIHAIEKGKIIPSKEDQMKLEKLLGVPLSKSSKRLRPRRL